MTAIPAIASTIVLLTCPLFVNAQRLEMPRRHDRPPGPALSADEAVARMTVPDGFSVEIVAAEPDVVNPVAMFIDERGRFWITESFEYPRKEPGPGRDRIKVLEDTDGDGKVDKTTIFAEGLNIPSGIAVGYGGVWVANSPDILFLQDTDGDLKADKQEVIVTGFGRDDTHELPNAFTWGPDGWLYGLNGVFNYCDVKYAETNPNFKPDHPGWKFTCAMWRIHPRTREFQIFAEGTSNPWGIAVNDEGDFFISACVIDHLWHIVETGYYIRQGGPYPPHTWPIRSIVDHKHQKAAYCGITWFDSDCYPAEYRKVLYMGNIHGGCINADLVERSGSTYQGKPHPGFTPKPGAWDQDEYGTIAKTGDEQNPRLADFLTANDAWFMPVVQTTGPDGCLYILDWYDRYHCYQDANADPAGIEREKGRLYRVRYQATPHAQPFDLSKNSDDELIEQLGGPNEYVRSTARRLLSERGSPEVQAKLLKLVVDPKLETSSRLVALWSATGIGTVPPQQLQAVLRDHETPRQLKSWALRLLGEQGAITDQVLSTNGSKLPADVQLQTIVAVTKSDAVNRAMDTQAVCQVLGQHPEDAVLQHVGWNAIRRFLQADPKGTVRTLEQQIAANSAPTDGQIEVLIRSADWLYDDRAHLVEMLTLFESACQPTVHPQIQRRAMEMLARRVREQRGSTAFDVTLKARLEASVDALRKTSDESVAAPATVVAALWGYASAIASLRQEFQSHETPGPRRIEALRTLIASPDPSLSLQDLIGDLLTDPQSQTSFKGAIVDSVAASSRADEGVLSLLLDSYAQLPPEVQPKAIEALTQRPAWAKPLLAAVAAKQIDKEAINLNQLRRISTFKDQDIQKSLKELYGEIREGRDPNREQVYYKMRDFLNGTPADPFKGEPVFKKVCGQCHKLHGEGAEVGPDITRNGRNNWEQLLWNVFDPSQVIGPGYQARILLTTDGRTLTGLPVEESDQRVVLKVQGGKQETIPRDQIEVYKVSELSLMPDQLEKQLTPQELADLLSFLAYDKHPTDPEAKRLSGAPEPQR